MPPAAGVADLLADLADTLARLGVPWYVFNAQAALIWGRPRLTLDVDVTVKLERVGTGDLIDALAGHGFTLRIEATQEFIRQTRVLPMAHPRSGLALDLVVQARGSILAGRVKDLEDIRGVLAERGSELRLDQIRETLTMLEAALGAKRPAAAV